MNTQHTATPWGIEDTGGAIWVGPMRRDGSKIAEIVFGIDIHGHTACSKADHRANAEFIVRACNSHETLVAALKRISDVSTNELNPGGSVYTALNLAKEAAQSALHNLK